MLTHSNERAQLETMRTPGEQRAFASQDGQNKCSAAHELRVRVSIETNMEQLMLRRQCLREAHRMASS